MWITMGWNTAFLLSGGNWQVEEKFWPLLTHHRKFRSCCSSLAADGTPTYPEDHSIWASIRPYPKLSSHPSSPEVFPIQFSPPRWCWGQNPKTILDSSFSLTHIQAISQSNWLDLHMHRERNHFWSTGGTVFFTCITAMASNWLPCFRLWSHQSIFSTEAKAIL